MKNRRIVHAYEHAKIYHNHYKPSLNIFRLLKSILGIIIAGGSPVAGHHLRRK